MIKILNGIKKLALNIIYSKKFEAHNVKTFNKYKLNNEDNNSLILVEFNHFCFEQIGFSYLIYCLKKKYNSKVESYFSHPVVTYSLKRNFIQKLKFFLGRTFNIKNFGIYNSLGINKFHFPEPKETHILKANKIYKKFLKVNNTRERILNFKIDNILLGDLLYDSYLKKNYDIKPTIFLDDEKFLSFSYEFILYSIIWIDFFQKNKIKAVMGSHCVYSVGVPLRVAVYKDIDAFVINSENLTKLNKKLPLQYCEFHNYRKAFKKITLKNQKKGLQIAKKRFLDRLSGKFSPDYHYATKSPFKKNNNSSKNIIKKSNKIKLIVATHDFVDAPHTLGNSFFPDFYQWLLFLGKISKKTDYDWYIKTHIPYGGKFDLYQPHERYVVKNFVKDYPKFNIIPAKTTFPEIISNKIDGILTVNGTIGSEIPFFGIPIINASLNNPHINYNFNIHPKNKKELEKIIINFNKYRKKLKINKNEMYEYYFMRNIYYDKNWIMNTHNKMIKEIGYWGQWTYKMYEYWLKNFNKKKHEKLISSLEKYIKSNEYRLKNSEY